MKSNKIKNMLVVASVVVGTTLVGSTSAFAATLPSNSSVTTVSSCSEQSTAKTIKNIKTLKINTNDNKLISSVKSVKSVSNKSSITKDSNSTKKTTAHTKSVSGISLYSSSETGTVVNLNNGYELNFRSGPSTDYYVIGELPEGATFTILSQNNGWYEINYNGTVGYVYGYYVSTSNNSSNSGSYITYTVQSGDTLSGIASEYGVTVSQLEQWNSISNPNYLYVGETLTIYTNGSSASSSSNSSSSSSSSSNGSYITYTVQSGDTLSGIASEYGVTVSELEQWNSISNPNYLYVGETLTIYTNGSSSSSNSNSSSSNSSSSYQGSYSYTAPSDLVNFTASYEGFSSTPYWSGGWTVGFGQNYGDTYPGDVSYQQAWDTLQNSLTTYMDQVENLTQGCGLNQNQINALTDFSYNLGIGSLEDSQLLQDIQNGNMSYSTIMSDFQAWSYIDGSFSSGLYARRTAEAEMFLYGEYNDH